MIDHNYAYTAESHYISGDGTVVETNPRLDSPRFLANSGASRSAGNDFWIEITFAGNLHYVHEAILEKISSASHWTIT